MPTVPQPVHPRKVELLLDPSGDRVSPAWMHLFKVIFTAVHIAPATHCSHDAALRRFNRFCVLYESCGVIVVLFCERVGLTTPGPHRQSKLPRSQQCKYHSVCHLHAINSHYIRLHIQIYILKQSYPSFLYPTASFNYSLINFNGRGCLSWWSSSNVDSAS